MKPRIACVITVWLSLVVALTPLVVAQTSSQTASALPRLVRFGGTVKDLNGNPLTGVVGITFALYSEQSGGATLWLETQNVTADNTGHYTALLGSTKPDGLPAELFTSEQARWVGVQVSGQPEQPRVLLVSAPYALKAGDAETIGGLPPSAFVLAAPPTVGTSVIEGATSSPPSSSSSSVSPATSSDVTTTGGTASTIPMYTTATNIQNSILTQTGTTSVNVVGKLNLPSTAAATKTAGADSRILEFVASSFSSTSSAAVNQNFQWRAEPAANDTASPSGTLNLLYGLGTAVPTETGLELSSKGILTFAAGQTFPGTGDGTLTGITTAAGSGLSGGGTTGTLSLKVPAAGITNAMLADSTITLNNNTAGGLTTPGAMTLGSTYTIGLKPCATSQILQYSGTTWTCVAPTGTGTITGVTAGTDLTGGGTAGKVTLNLDTTKVPQLSSANTFTGSQSLSSGDLSLAATSSANSGVINIGGIPFLQGFSKGNQNVFVGGAGNFTTSGTANAATGFGALAAQSSGSHNTAAGADALAGVTTGGSNTGVGFSAGPTGGGLSNTTAVGANAKVGQSNSLVLGQTTAGSPGATHVNVGIGTATPISTMELAVSSAGAIGPILTLTNPGGDNTSTFADGAAAIDFNTTAISTSGTYNPGARIEAVDDGVHSTDINFLSNIYGGGSGTQNGGLQTNMTIFGLSGTVSIGTNEAQAQLEVIGTSEEGVWAFGGTEPDFGMVQGLNGLRAGGGPSDGTDTGGIGAWLFGGDVDDGGTGTTGEGLLVWTGETESGTVGLAADFEGDVFVDGTLSDNTEEFKIDHPLDPANKYLVHASVESSEMMNIYSGNVTTDEFGLATVTLPAWFQAENTDFRYQLTVVDERFAQAIVSKRIENNQFTIHTNATNVQVSWQITAVRQDAYAKAHPMVVEQVKGDKERGFYQHPELYGQPKEKQTQWGLHPAMVQKMVAEKRKLKEKALNKQKRTNTDPQTRPSTTAVNYSQLN